MCFSDISPDSATAVYARFTPAGYAGRVAIRPLSPGSGAIALTISLINQLAQTAVLVVRGAVPAEETVAQKAVVGNLVTA